MKQTLTGTFIRKPSKPWDAVQGGYALETEAGLVPIFTGGNGVPLADVQANLGRTVTLEAELDKQGWIYQIADGALAPNPGS